ncbi:MAG: sugar phosphate isomerase/epimerase [Defluviitaleaceae bacterium]|nr:sugar phosphate isomerase/epimerase [Defluviitaleaceae bacterium]
MYILQSRQKKPLYGCFSSEHKIIIIDEKRYNWQGLLLHVIIREKWELIYMKYGYCTDLNFLEGDETSRAIFEGIIKAGFDYVELPFSKLSELSGEQIAKLKDELKKIPCKACNLFFPPALTIVGTGMNANGIMAYLERMLPLAAEIGIETLVFGNGGARKIPSGGTRESIWQNLRLITEIMEINAAKAGITICIEPLNTTETNIINSYSEAVELSFGLKNVSAMIDSYHVAMEKQTYEDAIKYPDSVKHLHTAYPTGRMVPSPEDDMSLYADFAKAIKAIGYDDKISIEGALRSKSPTDIHSEIKSALGILKSLF